MARRLDTRELAIEISLQDSNFRSGVNNVIGGLNRIESEAGQVDSAFSGIGGRIRSGLSGVQSSIGQAFSGENIKKGIAGLGLAFTRVGITADNFNVNLNKTKLALNLTEREAKKMGDGIRKNFSGGFGESLTDTFNATTRLKQNFKGLKDNELEDLTKSVLSFSSVFGKDYGDVIRALKGGTEGFGTDTKTTLNNLISIMTQGGDRRNDLLDTFREYPSTLNRFDKSLKKVSIEDFSKTLIKSSELGVFNYDKIGDLLKEINVVTNDASFIHGIGLMGNSAKNLRNEFIKGKINIVEFNAGLSKEFNKMPLEKQRQVATEIFRTMGEDIGKVVLGLGDYNNIQIQTGNNIDVLNTKYGETVGVLEKMKRRGFFRSTSLDTAEMTKQTEKITEFGQIMRIGLGEGFKGLLGFIDGVIGGMDELSKTMDEFSKSEAFQTLKNIGGGIGKAFSYTVPGMLLDKGIDMINPPSVEEIKAEKKAKQSNTTIVVNTGAVLDNSEKILKTIEKGNQVKKDLNIK